VGTSELLHPDLLIEIEAAASRRLTVRDRSGVTGG